MVDLEERSQLLKPAPRFDRVARIYAPIERLVFGRTLARCREQYLSEIGGAKRALIFGDGDGRFTAALLAAHPTIEVTAIDASQGMLDLLRANVERRTPEARLETVCTDARTYRPTSSHDLVVTHFFLDCLTTAEVEELIASVLPSLTANARWIVSDFAAPGGWVRGPAWLFVRFLYLVFRVLTGLRVTQLPEHAEVFQRAGFRLVRTDARLFGLLRCELWERQGP